MGKVRFNQTEPYAGPFPRKRHYHRCAKCVGRGFNGVYCYKAKCSLPRDLAGCLSCAGRHVLFSDDTPETRAAAPLVSAAAELIAETEQGPIFKVHDARCGFLQPAQRPCDCEGLRVADEWGRLLSDDDGGRTAAGNVSECEDCGQPIDECECDESELGADEGCEVCGCSPCSCDGVECEGCGLLVCECEGEDESSQGDLFGAGSSAQPATFAQQWDREAHERNQARRAELASNPQLIEDALPGFQSILERYHAAILGDDIPLAHRICDEADAYVDALQGGDRFGCKCEDGAATLLERAAAAPVGEVPTWGQCGDFILTVLGVRVRITWGGLFGLGFAIHAVDWEKPFFSGTGYRSFATMPGPQFERSPENCTVERWVTHCIESYAKQELTHKKRGLQLEQIGDQYGERHAPAQPLPIESPEALFVPPTHSMTGTQLSLF